MDKMQIVKKLATNSRVSVIGAGISGLSYAYFLSRLRPDIQIDVFEKEGRVGGYIKTSVASDKVREITGVTSKRGLKMEKGPRTLRGVSPGTLIIVDLLNKIGKLDQLCGVPMKSDGNKKYLLADNENMQGQLGQMHGELIQVPGPGCSISATSRFLGSKYGKIMILGLLKDLFYKKGKDGDINYKNDSVEDFMVRHFGKGMIDEIGSALMYGIYATDVAELSSECVFPGMVKLEKQGGSLIRTVIKNNMKRGKENAAVAKIDESVELYLNHVGSEFNMEKLSKLLKQFPMLALKDGLSVLCDGLKESMPSNVNIVTNSGVEKIEQVDENGQITVLCKDGRRAQYDHVRSTVNTIQLMKMMGHEDVQLKDTLGQFKYTSVTVCNVLIPAKEVKRYKGFGFLIPKAKFNADVGLMGMIFDSDVEESGRFLFPDGEASIPPVLKGEGSQGEDDKAVESFEAGVVESEGVAGEDMTKVTMMVHASSAAAGRATRGKLAMLAQDTFTNLLSGADGAQWATVQARMAVESVTWADSIPVYDTVGDGFAVRRAAVEGLVAQKFAGAVTLGGMTFAQGVGVPDGVVSALRGAVGAACGAQGSRH